MTFTQQRKNRKTATNTGFASGGVTCKLGALCFYSSSVLVDSLVLRNPPERKAQNVIGNRFATKLKNVLTMKKNSFFSTLFFLISLVCYAQSKTAEPLIIFLNLNSSIVESYSISKDSTRASFNLYFHGYEEKSKRDNTLKNFDVKAVAGFNSPSFSIGFIATESPTIVTKKEYTMTAEEYCKGNLALKIPTFIMLEIGKRFYLWKCITLPSE